MSEPAIYQSLNAIAQYFTGKEVSLEVRASHGEVLIPRTNYKLDLNQDRLSAQAQNTTFLLPIDMIWMVWLDQKNMQYVIYVGP